MEMWSRKVAVASIKITGRKVLGLHSEKAKESTEGRRSTKTLRKNVVGKNATEGIVCYL